MIFFVLYLLTVLAANLAVQEIGIIPVGFGLMAPAGVFFVGITLVLRDFVHERYGVRGSLLAIALGSLLSLLLASPGLVLASIVAFVLAELLDLLVYVPARRRWGMAAGVLLSGVVGSLVDTYVFLRLAFPGQWQDFFAGQLLWKIIGTVLAAVALAALERRQQAVVTA